MKTYIAYLRQSTMKQQISGLGVEAQQGIIHSHVKNKPILAEYIETGEWENLTDLNFLQLAMCRKTNSILIVANWIDCRDVAFTSKLLEVMLVCSVTSTSQQINSAYHQQHSRI